jgi:hypothetical protein
MVIFMARGEVPAQTYKLLPPPANVKAEERAESPLRITIKGLSVLGGDQKLLSYWVTNASTKVIHSFVLLRTSNAGKKPETQIAEEGLLPGMSLTLPLFREKGYEDYPDTILAVDSAQFLDGSTWGPDLAGESEFWAAALEGQKKALADVKKVVEAGNDTALKEFIVREPYLPELARVENKTKQQQGFMRGYGVTIIGLRVEIQGRGDTNGIPSRIADMERNYGLAPVSNDGRKRIGRYYYSNEVVRVLGFTRGTKQLAVDESFAATSDWLKDVTIRVKNNSLKRIKYLSMSLEFPETRRSGNIMSYTMSCGVSPMGGYVSVSGPPVEPGETFEFRFDENEFSRLKKFIESRQPLDGLTRANIRISFIQYDDDTAWSGGSAMRRDSTDPRRWTPVGQ